jgi:hypothetical protein
MSASDRLLPAQEKVYAKLYDVDSMLAIDGSVASGFVVLLNNGASTSTSSSSSSSSPTSNGKKKKKNKRSQGLDETDNGLAFMALTSGNVLDACFGVKNPSARRREETPSTRKAQAAKDMLDECAGTDAFRSTAVEAYCDAFQTIVDHYKEMGKLNCVTRCFRANKIRRQTETNLRSAFSNLAKAVAETSPSSR